MLKLHAVYRENNGMWEGIVDGHRYIHVQGVDSLDTARELLMIYAAEELAERNKGKRCNWAITEETIL